MDMTTTNSGTPAREASHSAVSWAAIFAGAVAATAISLALLVLGSALGLSSVSFWGHADADAVKSFTVKSAIWLIVMQWLAAGLGGYLTGRLRTKWVNTHSEEVFFRDTVHGFLAWSLATVLAASVMASAASMMAGGGMHAMEMAGHAAPPAPPGGPQGNSSDPLGYYTDSLFRSTGSTNNTAAATSPDMRNETMRIIATDMKNGGVTETDKAYLAQLVSARTGLNQAAASKRVDDVLTQFDTAKEKAKQDAEAARKTAMHVSIFIFLSLLIGAFIASVSAAMGGMRRDEY